MSNQPRVYAVLDALGDPTRRQIVERLRHGPLPVGQLASTLTVGRPAVSKHLRVLEDAGLVQHRSHGTRNLYELAPEGPAALRQWLADTWDTVLAAFADHVQAQRETPDDSLRKLREREIPDDNDNPGTARGRRARRR